MRMPRRRYQIGALLGITGLAVAIFTASAFADPTKMDGQSDADAIVKAAKSTGTVIVTDDGESVQHFGSGTTTFGKKDTPDGEDQFRVASNTKMFVSTVLLQLVDEKKLNLDTPIGDHLPGLVTGKDIDESKITVRQLMQHTSGLADNLTSDVVADPRLQWKPPSPEDMVKLGLRHGSQSEPGAEFRYSNTGYTILGLLIEKLTGQRVGEAIDERIVKPLGLKETSYAYAGMKEMKGPHFRGYLGVPPLLFEVSGHEPGIWAAAGALVSSGSDLTEFLDALLNGKLLSDSMLEQMKTSFPDAHYGLGLQESELPCGTAWGHTGHVIGYVSFSFTTGDGRSVFVGINTSSTDLTNPSEQVAKAVTSALCGESTKAGSTLTKTISDEFTKANELSEAVNDKESTIYDKN